MLRDNDETEVIFDLLSRSLCFDGPQISESATAIAEAINDYWKLSPDDTCLVARDLEEKTSSADLALQAVRTALGATKHKWKGSNFLGRLKQAIAPKKWTNIVLVDDFMGTGQKVAKKIDWIKKKLPAKSGVKIYIVCFVAQESSVSVVDPLVNDFYAHRLLKRGISDHYPAGEKLDGSTSAMKRIEERFGTIPDDLSFGFGASESLYFPVWWNAPNNVFPVFWWNNHSMEPDFTPVLTRVSKT